MTIFEMIIEQKIPSTIVYETDEVIAFKDIEPKAPVHIVIVPKRVIPTVNDLEEADAALVGKLYLAAKHVAADQGVAESGYRLVVNCNRDAGQTIDHLHMHMLAGRELGWPPG